MSDKTYAEIVEGLKSVGCNLEAQVIESLLAILKMEARRNDELKAKLTARDESLDKANTQIERMRERDRWIPVSERLPDTENTVFIRLKTSGVIQYSSDEFSLIDNDFVSFGGDYITHWKPITPPTDKGERL